MKYDKILLRKKSILARKKKYSKVKKFNFRLIFQLIKRYFGKKKIIIAGYYPSNYEVDVLHFLKEASKKNFKLALPIIKNFNRMDFIPWAYGDPLYINKFGIMEPKNSKNKTFPDFVMVPLVAFDKKMNRIGYGKGYYDRILKKLRKVNKKIIFVGIAYSFQKYASIPVNKHDVKLDYIFTERGIIRAN